ncbi:MAG TPA: 23S rRNA (guanosine(2251)-2'-O)-methyltransferase RlmB [Polyangiaceae bacterium]|jgi:23S rRNA (guanosine2251-2'-O)-methyltransferase|nr:23S rRNA (guanosine(2251)-2'-O)-methyltransferase RlmB [Polyangiaceae bacterium]
MTEARLVLGIQPVREAIRAHGSGLARVAVMHGGNRRLEALARFASDQGVTVERIPRGKLDALSGGVSHQGAAAWAPPLELVAVEALAVPNALIVALDGITDPHNFGATIRSAVALGASAVLWGEHHAAPLTPATFRASAGAIEHARLCRVTSLKSAIAELRDRAITTISLDLGAERTLAELDLAAPIALVIGSEDEGVSRGVRQLCQQHARLPMTSTIGSLNASVAAAVAVYEAQRQRKP